MNKTRLDFIDRIKGIAILLVVLGHIIQLNNIDGGLNNRLFGIINSFHMPLFFIISGYVAGLGRNRISSPKLLLSYLYKKSYTLLLPLLTWSIVVQGYFFSQNIPLISWMNIVNAFIHPGLWFLQVLFEIHVLFGLFCLLENYFNKKCRIWINLFLTLLLLFIPVMGIFWIDKGHFSSVVLFSFFFFFGSFIPRYDYIEKILMNKIVFTIAIVSFITLSSHWQIGRSTLDVILKVVVSFFAFITLLHITKEFKFQQTIDSQIQLIGRESLAIYVMHFYITFQITFFSILNGCNLYMQFVIVSALAVLIAYICIGVHRLFQKSDILNLLLYGKVR